MPRGKYFRTEYHKKQMSIILSEAMNRPDIIKKQRQGALRRWARWRLEPKEKKPKGKFDSFSTEELEQMANDFEGQFSLYGLCDICKQVFFLALHAEKTKGLREKYITMLTELEKNRRLLEEARQKRRG